MSAIACVPNIFFFRKHNKLAKFTHARWKNNTTLFGKLQIFQFDLAVLNDMMCYTHERNALFCISYTRKTTSS